MTRPRILLCLDQTSVAKLQRYTSSCGTRTQSLRKWRRSTPSSLKIAWTTYLMTRKLTSSHCVSVITTGQVVSCSTSVSSVLDTVLILCCVVLIFLFLYGCDYKVFFSFHCFSLVKKQVYIHLEVSAILQALDQPGGFPP